MATSSKKALSMEIQAALQLPDQFKVGPVSRGSDAAAEHAEREGPVAVLAIHGVHPTQRYEMQDQFADGFGAYLNAVEKVAGTKFSWQAGIHWPPAPDTNLRPSVIRLRRVASGANEALNDPETHQSINCDAPEPLPTERFYDVYEGYWSPLTKRKTNGLSMLGWFIGALFSATSSTAAIPCDRGKLFWDFGYAGAFLVVAFWAGLGALWSLSHAVAAFRVAYLPPTTSAPQLSSIGDLISFVWNLDNGARAEITIAVVFLFTIIQLLNLIAHGSRAELRSSKLRTDSPKKDGHFRTQSITARSWRLGVFALLISVLVIVVAAQAVFVHVGLTRWDSVPIILWLLVSVALIQGGRWLIDFVVTEILGDVQVHTTHDTNADFYKIRSDVIETVAEALLGVLASNVEYRRIHVAGHSLGSTIGMDVLMRVAMIVNSDPALQRQWNAISSFITFGTALEKTRFFFDVQRPTRSAAHDQWDADVFGKYFTADPKALNALPGPNTGIYWGNFIYWNDIVSNEIVSYTSDVAVGAPFASWGAADRVLAENIPLIPKGSRFAFTHGDYVGDKWFWVNAGSALTA